LNHRTHIAAGKEEKRDETGKTRIGGERRNKKSCAIWWGKQPGQTRKNGCECEDIVRILTGLQEITEAERHTSSLGRKTDHGNRSSQPSRTRMAGC
jgi:hypothetical protein